jgi:hypothetical protein
MSQFCLPLIQLFANDISDVVACNHGERNAHEWNDDDVRGEFNVVATTSNDAAPAGSIGDSSAK